MGGDRVDRNEQIRQLADFYAVHPSHFWGCTQEALDDAWLVAIVHWHQPLSVA